MKIIKNLFPAIFLSLVFSLNLNAQRTSDQGFEVLKNLDIFTSAVKELNINYVDDINPGELTKSAIDGMLETLDPYTNYISESEIEDYKFITTGEYGGIGALIHQNGDYVVISEPYENSPAQKADLRAGDKLVEINGQSAKGKSYSDVSAILKGQAGTEITVKIERAGEKQPITKTIKREIIKIESIPFYGMIGDSIGYIKLISFTQKSGEEVKTAFQKLRENNALKGMIIDLRGNGGGLLNEAVDITNIFVERGTDVVTTKGKLPDKNHTYKTTFPALDKEIPLVVLVNGQSASASEILSGSIQDLDRGVIIGQRTFGKGLVQNVVPLSFNSQMKITVAKYYIPSGRCIQAIDYSHKTRDGKFSTTPDSLITAFKTRNGRVVYEGRGIKPDIHTRKEAISNIAYSLYSKYLIFDYATKYRQEHTQIAPPDQFQVTDEILDDFRKFIADKDYSYQTLSEEALEDLKRDAEKEKYFDAIKKEYEALHVQMAEDKKGDFDKHKEQISDLLKFEIISRYYYQKGKVVSSLKSDKDILEAKKTLLDKGLYSSILAGNYKPATEPEEDPTTLDEVVGSIDE